MISKKLLIIIKIGYTCSMIRDSVDLGLKPGRVEEKIAEEKT